ncbi:hypothetical protein BC827DRAFT_863621 [Russula dissimulans]|nr:hypothetical protein BC827DRAFT_863621 [Russula dissimulans]
MRFERWNNFHANLKQAIEIWKARPPSCQSDAGILRREKAYSSTGANTGSIVFSLLPAIGSLKEVLKRVGSSASLEHTSHLGTSLVLRLELAYAENRDLCLCFLQRCIQFAEIMTCPPHITGPISSHVGSLQDLQDWAMRSRFDATGVSAESAAGAQGLSSNQLSPFNGSHRHRGHYCLPGSQEFKTTHKKALSLQQKTISELDNLLEISHPMSRSRMAYLTLSPWVSSPFNNSTIIIYLGGSERLCARSARSSDERTSQPIVLPVRPAGFDAPPIWNRTDMDRTSLVCFL